MMSTTERIETMIEWFQKLFVPKAWYELRCLTNGPALTGVFDNIEALINNAIVAEEEGYACYFCMNPTNHLPMNEIAPGSAIHDDEIVNRHLMLIDCDPTRPAKTCSTNEEKREALDVALMVLHYLKNKGWPLPFVADSGNGYHLLYRIDLHPKSNLIEKCLLALSQKFTVPTVKIDTVVFNPSRICRFYGTLNCKGENTPERPHRYSKMLKIGSDSIVTREQLQELSDDAVEMKKDNWAEADKAAKTAFEHRDARPTFLQDDDIQPWQEPRFNGFGPKVLATMFDDRQIAKQIAQRLTTEHFDDKYEQAIVEVGLSYFGECHEWPTRDVLKHRIKKIDGISVEEFTVLTTLIDTPSDPRERLEVTETLEEWIHAIVARQINDYMLQPTTQAILRKGKLDEIQKVIQRAQDENVFNLQPQTAISATELLKSSSSTNWLVKDVLVAHEFAGLGAPFKCCKTRIANDLAISLASGTHFLGTYATKQCNVLYISGESGQDDMRRMTKSVLDSKRLDSLDNLFFDFKILNIDVGSLKSLSRQAAALKAGLVIVDPFYTIGLDPKTQHGDLFAMQQPLRDITAACQDAGATLLMVHHHNRDEKKTGLNKFAFAGFAENVRQWIQIERIVPYKDDLIHWFEINGGGCGRSFRQIFQIDETGDELGWKITPHDVAPAKNNKQASMQSAEQEMAVALQVLQIIKVAENNGVRASKEYIKTGLHKSGAVTNKILEMCIEHDIIRQAQDQKGWYYKTKEQPSQ